ncbi:MAG: serine/threonine protein kinase [Gemmatimonadota bacterium]|nr:serine/threonine protein kinase [Gemmatimonadota bacterium]
MARNDIAEIGKYKVLGQIGEGAMGVVYRALDPVLNRQVAIKVMSDALARDTDLRGRFLREAQSAGSLQHPNVITIYDFGEVDGHPFIAMEFVEGADLHELLEQKRPLSLVQKLDVLIDVLNGLAYAHKRGIVHRDIKPANIRIDEDGRARVMDFGIAHLSSSKLTRTGTMIGTPAYMSPEQITGGEIAPASDLWAVGAVMYELLTGTQAFRGESLQTVMYKIVSAPAPDLTLAAIGLPPEKGEGVTKSLNVIVGKALEKDPEQRYTSAADMLSALSDVRARLIASDDPIRTVSLRATVAKAIAETAEHRVRTSRRNLYLAIAGGVLAASAIAVAVWPRQHQSGSIANAGATAAPVTAATPREVTLGATPPVGVPANTAPSPPSVSHQIPATPTPTAISSPRPSSTAASTRDLGRMPGLQATAIDVRRRAAEAGASAAESARMASAASASARVVATDAPKSSTSISTVVAQVAAPPAVVRTAAQPAVNPSAEIATVVAAYARALESRDIALVRRAYPGITGAQANGWEQFFATLRSFKASFVMSGLAVNGTSADARLTGSYDYVTDGGKAAQQPVSFQAAFRRDGLAWQLVSVH